MSCLGSLQLPESIACLGAPLLPRAVAARASSCRSVPCAVRSNPSIERTSSSRLRLLPAAAHVER